MRIIRHSTGAFVALALLFALPAAEAQTRVFIASDSTAQDYTPERYPQQGWGTMLRCAFGPDVTVENRAIGGRSTRSFINEGRLDEIARDIRAGDTLLIQFGHNDANIQKPERYTSVADYAAFLRRYIEVAAKAGAQPVLLTPVTRRNFVDGKVQPSFPAYSNAVRTVARETGAPLIDLDTLSGNWVQGVGVEGSKRLFLHYTAADGARGFPQGVQDDTHFSELGARGVAEIVAGALAKLALPVSSHVLAERPALTRTTPVGSAACAAPGAVVHRFRFAGPAQPGEVGVAAGKPYDGSYGFEPGPASLFSLALPEGNYRVTVTLGDRKAASDTTIEAESRRLMLRNAPTAAGRFITRSFVVNVRTPSLAPPPANAPGGSQVRLNPREQGSYTWDGKLTLALLGPAPRLAAMTIEPAEVATIFLFGDSTVTDQRFAPNASWGQMLPAFFGSQAAIANHAEAGETLKSFLGELRLDKALATMRAGDFALIQFGHNDQKSQWPQTYAAAGTTYRAWLRAYIAEVRLHGATPILVTPPERRNFTPQGMIRPSLSDYAEAVRAVAADERVQLIDLNAASIRFYEALGPARAPLAFADGGRDGTHHDDYGAYILASAVADAIRIGGGPLAALLAPGLLPFDPTQPPAPEGFQLTGEGAK